MFKGLLTLALLLTMAPLAIAGAAPETTEQEKATEASLFSESGYRQGRYRSPTPATVAGGQTIDTGKLQSMLNAQPDLILIDVINATYHNDRFFQDGPHLTVPGAHWLPNTGTGHLDTMWHDYLTDNVARLSGNNQDRPIVVLCKSDCWLSWNAAKRLIEAGYQQVYWYRNGIDSWIQAGLPTSIVDPVEPASS